MASLQNQTLGQHLAKEIKDPTQVEIVTEMVAAWIKAQAEKFVYFDDDDPCTCGDDCGDSHRVEAGVNSLADDIANSKITLWHSTGECHEDDEEDED